MQWYEFLIIFAIFLVALSFLILSAIRKRKGKALPGDDCSGNCASCGKGCLNGKKLVEEYHHCCAKRES